MKGDEPPAKEPEKPNFGNSGLLARETNLVKGVQIKYNEPPEARKPLKNWRLYVFKGTEQIGTSTLSVSNGKILTSRPHTYIQTIGVSSWSRYCCKYHVIRPSESELMIRSRIYQ